MKKITIKGKDVSLQQEINLKGMHLVFKAKDRKGDDFLSGSIKTKKVISIFPKLNTGVCDKQTMWLAKNAGKYSNVTFISLTNDDVDTIDKWCISREVDNAIIVSDRQYNDFDKQTHLTVAEEQLLEEPYKSFALKEKLVTPESKVFIRGFIILDENNDVIQSFFQEELTADPDYEALEKILKSF